MNHNPAIALFLALGLIILASRIGGAIARRLGQPRVLGELIIGVLLGPTLLDLLHQPVFQGIELGETIKELAELGVLLLMFIVGLEVKPAELARVGRVGIIAGFAGALVPVLLTMPIVLAFNYAWPPALFAGVTLAATSVSISAQVLLELGLLRTQVGSALLATALIDDVLAILLLSLAVALTANGGTAENTDFGALLVIVLRMVIYLGAAFTLAWFVVPRAMNWIEEQAGFSGAFGIPAFALVFTLLFAWSAEVLGGVAAITGAFIAGIGLSRTRERVRHEIEEAASYIAYAFLVPIFFVDVGLETDLSTFPLSAFPLALLLLSVGVVSKVGGCGAGALLGGFNRNEALRLGVCMISRGEVGLIIATVGLANGIFTREDPLFASLFLTILLTTLLTPLLVRRVFPRSEHTSAAIGESQKVEA